ncbi:hypothetical protein, partial [Vibrio sp. 03_296]|uniref:hypothetical protein n=1 Tax=Vibrio sp. 03_296 TaxID=2024409 RepID=UPI002D7EAC92
RLRTKNGIWLSLCRAGAILQAQSPLVMQDSLDRQLNATCLLMSCVDSTPHSYPQSLDVSRRCFVRTKA